jgi:pterin-4a-carbinolamine dehydratase
MRPPLVFVSYRRRDTGPFALALRAELDLRLDGVPLFLDVNRIQGGDLWVQVLDDALTRASILIALIGPNWEGKTEGQAPRIGLADDWVRQEVARALRDPSDAILPVLVNRGAMPAEAELPDDVRRILAFQAIPLRAQSWDADIGNLCQVLEQRFSVRVKQLGELLPKPGKLSKLEEPLSNEALEKTCREGLLDGWDVEMVHDVRKSGYMREFLRKRFVCKSDAQAFDFVEALRGLTHQLEHHPVVEMVFKTVVIKLSTFDAGHRITTLDRRMAVAIDHLFNRLGMSRP